MKTPKLLIVIISFLLELPAFAQVQIDKQIQLTGTGTDAEITGIKSVINNQDATSAGSIQKGRLIYAMASGSSNNFMLNITPAISVYDTGMVINFLSNQTVTGVTTLNVNSLGPKTIKKYVNNDLSGCEIMNGQAVTVIYDGTNFQLPAVSPILEATVANAGSDQLNVLSGPPTGATVTLAGNAPTVGSGSWSIVSGTGGSVASPSNPTSAFTGVSGNSYVLAWTIASICGSNSDSVNISFANYTSGSQPYTTTGGPVTFTVPSGVQQVTVECWGAQGQGGGGLGGYAKGVLSISAGSQLSVYVGGQNGTNGGGTGVSGHNGGGGADVRQTGTALTNRIIVAGGGGSVGGDVGIDTGGYGGGGVACSNGAGGGGGGCENLTYAGYGLSGTRTNGGSAGISVGTPPNPGYSSGGGGGGLTSGGGGSTSSYGANGTDGTLGQGGNHGVFTTGNCTVAGAGGGGGYYGGGGTADANCSSGGAGGGSSWASGSLTSLVFTGGVQTGDGKVVISW